MPKADDNSGGPNLTTSVYQSHLGLFSVSWSLSSLLLTRSLHVTFLRTQQNQPPLSLHLHVRRPFFFFFFFPKSGSKKLAPNIRVFWDFSRARFGSRPEPDSGYYIAVLVDGEMSMLAGDLPDEAYSKTRAKNPSPRGNNNINNQIMVLRTEHVFGNNSYTTKAQIAGKTRDVSIDCRAAAAGDDPRLYFSIDNKRVLQVKHLKWKFRGNERIEVDGVYIQVSWDVYNWLFDDDVRDGYALFMFRFEKQGLGNDEDDRISHFNLKNGLLFESQQSCVVGFEKKKMKKRMLRSARSPSSSSLSSASSGCGSVMEWESVEENELKGPSDFSLLVYAWKS